MSLTRKTSNDCDQNNKSMRLCAEFTSKRKASFNSINHFTTFLHRMIWGTWNPFKLPAEPTTIIFVSALNIYLLYFIKSAKDDFFPSDSQHPWLPQSYQSSTCKKFWQILFIKYSKYHQWWPWEPPCILLCRCSSEDWHVCK